MCKLTPGHARSLGPGLGGMGAGFGRGEEGGQQGAASASCSPPFLRDFIQMLATCRAPATHCCRPLPCLQTPAFCPLIPNPRNGSLLPPDEYRINVVLRLHLPLPHAHPCPPIVPQVLHLRFPFQDDLLQQHAAASTCRLSIDPPSLFQLFPFHMVLDRECRLVQVRGAVLPLYCLPPLQYFHMVLGRQGVLARAGVPAWCCIAL